MQTVSQAHAEACGNIQELIEKIQSAVFDITPADRKQINWSHVGTMNHVAHMLAETLATLKNGN